MIEIRYYIVRNNGIIYESSHFLLSQNILYLKINYKFLKYFSDALVQEKISHQFVNQIPINITPP